MNYPFDFYSAQSEQQDKPVTVASAATITPVGKFTKVTGTTSITTIVPPNPGGYCEITLMFTDAYANAVNTGVSTRGGIAVAYTSVALRPITLSYDPRTGLWYPWAVA